MRINIFGEIICNEWNKSEKIRNEIKIGPYVIMPNHIHGIVFIRQDAHRRGDRPVALLPAGPKPRSLSSLVAGFKSSATKRINSIRRTPGNAVWQRNYYEHIIRDEYDYNRIVEYLEINPKKWDEDSLNPAYESLALPQIEKYRFTQ